MKRFLFLALLPVFLGHQRAEAAGSFAASGVLYGASTSYQSSPYKKSTTQAGAYLYMGFGLHHSLELEADTMEQSYITGGTPLKQKDYTSVYTYYGTSSKMRFGLHALDTTDMRTQSGMALFTGYNYFVPYSWNLGLDLYQSMYPKYNGPSTTGEKEPPPSVTQATPSLGLFFLNAYLYSQTQIDYIKPEAAIGLSKSSYVSARETLTYYAGSWVYSGYVWGGEQVFVVSSGGFSIVNSAEVSKGGAGASLKYIMTPSAALTAEVSMTQTEDSYSLKTYTATTAVAKFGYSF